MLICAKFHENRTFTVWEILMSNLHNKTRYVCLSVCMLLLPMAGRTAGPIKTKLGIGTHVDPRSVLVKVKVKVIYLCVRYNWVHDSDTWRTTMKHACSSSSSSAVAGATWWTLIKRLTSARQRARRAERIEARRAKTVVCYLQLVEYNY